MSSPASGVDPGLIVSGIAAVLQAAQTWMSYRDSGRAASVFRDVFQSGTANPELAQAAVQLSLVPIGVLNAFGTRVEACWTKYEEMLVSPAGTYMPSELDDATEAVKRCVCRELKRLKSINGTLPSGKFSQWFTQYGCR